MDLERVWLGAHRSRRRWCPARRLPRSMAGIFEELGLCDRVEPHAALRSVVGRSNREPPRPAAPIVPHVLGLLAAVCAIGIGESVNLAMILAALYLAGGARPLRRLLAFALAVFSVYLAAGLVVVLGPGELILAAVPRPSLAARHIGEVVVGAGLLVGAALLFGRRRTVAGRIVPGARAGGRSGATLGAAMSMVELPTAFPYLAAIGVIVDSGVDVAGRIVLLVAFNVCVVLPLIAIVLVSWLAGERAHAGLGMARRWIERRWPVVFAAAGAIAGTVVLAVGLVGIARG